MPDDQAEKPADQVEQITSGSSLPPPDEIYDPISIPILDSVRENHKSNIEAQLKWMTRLFGIATVQRGFEETHRFIFGSQLMLLYRTNAMGGSLIPEIAKQIYDVARSQWSAAYQTITFDAWIGFLLSRNLIRRSHLAGSEVFQLTPTGKAYLSYIVERQLPEKNIG